jgi:hypothetical protein
MTAPAMTRAPAEKHRAPGLILNLSGAPQASLAQVKMATLKAFALGYGELYR